MPRPRAILFAAALATVALAGCGISDPYQHQQPTSTAAAAAASPTTSMSTSTSAAPAGIGMLATLRRYATLSINWTSHTLAAHQRALETIATGGALAQAQQTTATYGAHSTLQHSGVQNHGQITSIAAGQGLEHGRWVITTRETTTGRGDYHGLPAQAHVYYAQLVDTPHGWRVSRWSPH